METLKELYKRLNNKNLMIAVYDGTPEVYPDYADEYLETHGSRVVKQHVIKDNVLIVILED